MVHIVGIIKSSCKVIMKTCAMFKCNPIYTTILTNKINMVISSFFYVCLLVSSS